MITSFPVFIPGEGGAFLFPSTFQKKCLIAGYTDDGVFDDFPKISHHFLKIFKIVPGARTFSEHFRRLPKTFEENPKMFRLYTKEFKYNLRDKLDISEIIDIFTSEDVENTPL